MPAPKHDVLGTLPLGSLRAAAHLVASAGSEIRIRSGQICSRIHFREGLATAFRPLDTRASAGDFETALDEGYITRETVDLPAEDLMPGDLVYRRRDDLPEAVAERILSVLADHDYGESLALPGAVPVAVMRHVGTGYPRHSTLAGYLVRDVDRHLIHGVLVDETKHTIVLRDAITHEGHPLTDRWLKANEIHGDHANGVTTLGTERLALGLSRAAFLEIAEAESSMMDRLRAAQELADAELGAVLERASASIDGIRASHMATMEGLRGDSTPPDEFPDESARSRRMAARFLSVLNRPVEELVEEIARIEAGGGPKRQIADIMNEAGLDCHYGNFRQRQKKLLSAYHACREQPPAEDFGSFASSP